MRETVNRAGTMDCLELCGNHAPLRTADDGGMELSDHDLAALRLVVAASLGGPLLVAVQLLWFDLLDDDGDR